MMIPLIAQGLAFFSLVSAQAGVPVENPCVPIIVACEDQGFIDDKIANFGQRIWADCADLIINKGQKVRGISLDANRIKLCQKYKLSRDFPIDTD